MSNGVVRAEKTILLKEAQDLSRARATWGSGSFPIASRLYLIFSTRFLVSDRQYSAVPTGAPSILKQPSNLRGMLCSNKSQLIPLPPGTAGTNSHLELLRRKPRGAAEVFSCLIPSATADWSPAIVKSSKYEKERSILGILARFIRTG